MDEVKEAWGSPGVESPSFNTTDISLTPIHSFTDDLGYQGSQDLTSEEDPSLVPGKRQKRNKTATFRMRRNKVREEDENDKEDEEDEAGRSPRARIRELLFALLLSGLLGTGLLKRQICLEGCGPRHFLLAINGVYGTKGNTLLS
ncbi:hypothetical protein R6Z07M_000957 [Ovis aries]